MHYFQNSLKFVPANNRTPKVDNGEIILADYHDISYRIIYAFDKDLLRYETLLKMIEASSASCVVSMCQDFLKVLIIIILCGS